MKNKFTIAMVLIAIGVFAQAPANYYNNATGSGYELKTQLYNIIRAGHTTRSYRELYECYETSDRDYIYENDGTILDIYSENPSGPDPYNYGAVSEGNRCGTYAVEGDCYNREHLIPQSVFNENSPMVSDAHHILPTDGKVNNQRSNYPFGKVGTTNYTSLNGSKRGANLNSGYSAGYTGVVFEPIDEFKGDVARCLLYMATRYQNVITNWDNWPMLDDTSNHVFTDWALNVLLTWHQQDPVSDKEIARNNAVYDFQGNRNPFIDNPEYAGQIWGTVAGINDVWSATLSVYPNPATNHEVNIYSEMPLETIELININGQLIQTLKKPQAVSNTYTLKDLSQGFYMLRATSGNHTEVKKIIVN
jgi:endonuclease I